MKKNLILLLLIVTCWQFSLAQRTITGTVKSAEDNSALPGVNVLIKGTSTGVVTNINGKYQIEVPDGAEYLVFSFIGMKPQEIAISNQSTINVNLEPDVKGLDEVISSPSIAEISLVPTL